MKKAIILAVVVLAALFVGALLWFKPTSTPSATLSLSGQEGVLFKATIKADGVEVRFSGQLPTEVQVTGHSIDCDFQKTQPDGRISLAVVTSDGEKGAAATPSPQGGVRTQISRTLFVRKFMTTTF